MKILIVNGPNLHMLGKRKAEHYGSLTLAQLEKQVADYAAKNDVETEFFQSNCEGRLIDVITDNDADAIVLNAGAYTHYSYAIADAVECCGKPVVEVHLSDVEKREDFRKKACLLLCAPRGFTARNRAVILTP